MKIFTKDRFTSVLKVAVALGLLWWLSSKGLFNLSDFKELLKPQFIAIFLVLTALNLTIINYRWLILLQSRKFDTTFLKTAPLQLIGLFFNYLIPGGVGGDLVKGYYIAQDHPTRKVDAATSVIIDRIVGLYAMIILALIALSLNLQLALQNSSVRLVGIFVGLIAILMTMFFALAFSRRIRNIKRLEELICALPGGHILIKIYDAFHSYKDQPIAIVKTIALSLVSQLLAVAFMMVVGFALAQHHIPLAAYLFAVPLGFVVSAIPVAPAGIGVGQVAFMVLFKMYTGESSVVGQTGISAFQLVLLFYGLSGAFFYLRRKRPQFQDEGEL